MGTENKMKTPEWRAAVRPTNMKDVRRGSLCSGKGALFASVLWGFFSQTIAALRVGPSARADDDNQLQRTPASGRIGPRVQAIVAQFEGKNTSTSTSTTQLQQQDVEDSEVEEVKPVCAKNSDIEDTPRTTSSGSGSASSCGGGVQTDVEARNTFVSRIVSGIEQKAKDVREGKDKVLGKVGFFQGGTKRKRPDPDALDDSEDNNVTKLTRHYEQEINKLKRPRAAGGAGVTGSSGHADAQIMSRSRSNTQRSSGRHDDTISTSPAPSLDEHGNPSSASRRSNAGSPARTRMSNSGLLSSSRSESSPEDSSQGKDDGTAHTFSSKKISSKIGRGSEDGNTILSNTSTGGMQNTTVPSGEKSMFTSLVQRFCGRRAARREATGRGRYSWCRSLKTSPSPSRYRSRSPRRKQRQGE
ncbi:unnamed protein product [Amoebophrya sp. A25]|nr:unnamed protein product [Amoebophrya sp. A25]|eukprot:GSA25T00011847001.1